MLFTGPLVRAILDGQKTVTRRPMKRSNCRVWSRLDPDNRHPVHRDLWPMLCWETAKPDDGGVSVMYDDKGDGKWVRFAAKWQENEGLWVRETWTPDELDENGLDGIRFRADDAFVPIENSEKAADRWLDARGNHRIREWRPSIHIPRWASRIDLEVLNVRGERLQDITEDDAKAEGVDPYFDCEAGIGTCRRGFAVKWDEIYGDREWESNKMVWRIEFRRVRP